MKKKPKCSFCQEKWEKVVDSGTKKKSTFWWFMNSSVVKSEKYGHIHLTIYHFAIPSKE